MNYEKSLVEDFLHLSRIARSGRVQDVHVFIHRLIKKYGSMSPEIVNALSLSLRDAPMTASHLRRQKAKTLPVDIDSRLQLVRLEHISTLPIRPIFNRITMEALEQIINERMQAKKLNREGLSPARTALFVGPPGVGKTLSARYLAMKINKPLIILDLSAVMSSFLGRTGNNLRQVLDYAKSEDCILLLDEIDTIAKTRNDNTEIGELKRLVTVLLQEVDNWPDTSLLLAATNHPDLLDSAMWRRFEVVIDFPLPSKNEVEDAIKLFLGKEKKGLNPLITILVEVFVGRSFSDIERDIKGARKLSVIQNTSISGQLEKLIYKNIQSLDRPKKTHVANYILQNELLSQREVHDLTGISRDKLRKDLKSNNEIPTKERAYHD